MTITNVHFTCELHNGMGSKMWFTGEEPGRVGGGKCVVVAAPTTRKKLNDFRKKLGLLLWCICFCALWSGAQLLKAAGEKTKDARKESGDTSAQLTTSKVEGERSSSAEEAVKAGTSDASAAAPAAAGESQQEQKEGQSTEEVATANDGTTPAQSTPSKEEGDPKQKEEAVKSGKLDLHAAAAATAGDSHHEQSAAQRTKDEKEGHDAAHLLTEARIEDGQSKQSGEGEGPPELDVKTGAAAAAGDSPEAQKEEGRKDVKRKTSTPAAALRGLITLKDTSDGDSTVSTDAAVSAAAAADGLSESGETGKCILADAHTIFWRAKVKSTKVSTSLLTNNIEDSTESLGLYGAINPFFETLLSCGRSALAQKDLTELCIQARLEQLHRQPLTKSCIDCFTESVRCGAEHCRSACFLDSCSEKCLQCTNENCKPALERCAGLGPLPPICVPEEATPSQEEDEDRADGSRQQRAWNTFFHRFAESDEEDSG